MSDERLEVEVEVEPAAPETSAEIDAAAAAASAETAREAAALAIAQAEATTAEVATVAATELAAYQQRLEQCETQSSDAIRLAGESSQRIASLEANQAETVELLQSIRSRLEPPPEHPPSPPEEPPSESAEHPLATETTQPDGPPPEEPRAPERKRAHRWI